MNNDDNDDNGKTDLAPFVVTGIPLIILIIRHFVSSFVMDNYTIYLLLIAMTPWLAPWIKTLELSGFAKVDFNDMQNAAKQEGFLEKSEKSNFSSQTKSIIPIGSETKGELAKMGGVLADTLGKLAESKGISPQQNITQVIDSLRVDNSINDNQRSMLLGVTQIFNCQAPGLFSSACAKFICQFSDQRASC